MKKVLFPLWAVLIFIALLNCGGSGGGGDSSSPSVKNETANGIWLGTLSSDVLNQKFEFGGISQNNNIWLWTSSTFYVGNISITGDKLTGTLKGYTSTKFPDGSSITDCNFSGTVKTKNSMNGSYSGGGDQGSYQLSYNSLYERGSTLSYLVGNWILQTNTQWGSVTITIDANGNLTGSPSTGGTWSGNISIFDSSINAYSVVLDISNTIMANGHYDGIGFFSDTIKQNDTFIICAKNPTNAILLYIVKPSPAPELGKIFKDYGGGIFEEQKATAYIYGE